MPDIKIKNFGNPDRPWTVPESDMGRQAISPLRGYVYQLHQTAAAWITIKDGDELYLEIAEDYTQLLREPDKIDEILRATQLKDTRESGSVTLNSPDVLSAIENLFRLQAANSDRDVGLIFLTTSEIGKERKIPLPSGKAGLHVWSAVTEGADITELRTALLDRFEPGALREFIETSTDYQLRLRLISRLTFECGAPGWEAIEANNRNLLMALRQELRSTADMAHRAYDAVLARVIETILTSPTRSLNRDQLIACLEKATAIAMPSQVVMDHFAEPSVNSALGLIELQDLRKLSRTLLEVGRPPSVDLLFPDSSSAARSAFSEASAIQRTATETHPKDRQPARASILEIALREEWKHLIVGQPGSGKSHALWQTGQDLLVGEGVTPIYLPVARRRTWNEVRSIISDIAPAAHLDALLSDNRVCFLIDGWSEFAVGQSATEKQKALRALRDANVIATAQFADAGDAVFKQWSIELFTPAQVTSILATARTSEPLITDATIDLLRLPLLLSIRVLTGANVAATGELLRQFHSHLSRELPEGFSEVLTGAVAESALTNDHSYGRFIVDLKRRAATKGVNEPLKHLRQLGTLVERGGQVLPIHDLYWSWLAGCGLIADRLILQAIEPLHTRQSFVLALQSGVAAHDLDVAEATAGDLVLAAALDTSRRRQRCDSNLASGIDVALSDTRLAVRNRGGLAALELGRPEYLRRALDVLSELSTENIYVPEWPLALQPAILYPQRAIIADWLGSARSEFVIDAIAERGDANWVPWLEQMALSGKLTFVDALAAALGCSAMIPKWGYHHFDDLLRSKPWKLRAAAQRRSNVALARLVADNYERIVENVIPTNSSSWIDINRVIVACGDDAVFGSLLSRFATMSKRPQELLGFAIAERGAPWIAEFQKIAFAKAGGEHHHKLAEAFSPEIDDATARAWIAAGHDDMGWRVLVARHGNSILPELISSLPKSYGGQHHIPALVHMRHLTSAPKSLIDDLWSRLGSPMQPKAMQDLLQALATVHPEGVASIVAFIRDHPSSLPLYHLGQVLRLYEAWRKATGIAVGITLPSGQNLRFEHWVSIGVEH